MLVKFTGNQNLGLDSKLEFFFYLLDWLFNEFMICPLLRLLALASNQT